MIRFCNGEVYNIDGSEYSDAILNMFFEDFGHNIKIQIVNENKFIGMIEYDDFINGKPVNSTCVKLDSNIFKNARKIFSFYGKTYLPVVNENNELECFCYDENLSWDYYNYQLLLSDSYIARKIFEKYSGVVVWGLNEWSFNLVKSLMNANIPVAAKGEFWEECGIKNGNDIEELGDNVFTFRSEGNQGLALSDLGFWSNVFPEYEYDDIKDSFSKLVKDNTIFIKPVSDAHDVNELISDAIYNHIPFNVSRIGHTEAQIACCKENNFYDKMWLQWLYTTSGFFSANQNKSIDLQDVDSYVDRTINAIKNTNINIIFGPLASAYLVNKYANSQIVNTTFDEIGVLNSISNTLWTHALAGKKVLVISSVSETIRKQYNIKDKIHSRNILPDFELITLQAFETQLGNSLGFEKWEDAYKCLLDKVTSIDFDVALISAGAYGYPLSSDIKNIGKVAIELCSNLFPLFGIKTKRHDIMYEINKHWNEYWIYPIEQGPKNKHVIENGCYWR